MKYFLVIDEGTTSVRVISYSLESKILAIKQKEYEQIYTKPGYVEQDINDIIKSLDWCVLETIKELGDDIISIGIANQRETTVLFTKDAKPIYNAISWQCRRTSSLCETLKQQGLEAKIKAKTGLKIDPYFSATKIYWLLHNVPHALDLANNGKLLFGTIDTYLMYYLSNGKIFKTDVTNASRTMLYNIYSKEWDKELCKLLDIPLSMLANVYPSKHLFGYTSCDSIFKKEIPIMGVAGDQQAALFGHLGINKGDTKITYGTGCFILTNMCEDYQNIDDSLITTLGVEYDNKTNYLAEGSVFYGGSLIKWIRDNLGLIKTAKESEACALAVKDNLGIYIVPAFTGLGAPYWSPEARGIICGLTAGANKNHIVRAALEAICYQVNDVLNLIAKNNKLNNVYVDGGAAVNDFLMQFQADISNMQIKRPNNIERTSLGIYYLLALAYGINICDLVKDDYNLIYPLMNKKERENLLDGYKKAVLKALNN